VGSEDADVRAAKAGDRTAFGRLLAPYCRELRAHCYRMSGSLEDAEDLLQDSLLRAWKGMSSFEGRSSVRTWLFAIATNVCLNALDAGKARTLPTEIGPRVERFEGLVPIPVDPIWLEPWPDELGPAMRETPEARVSERESVSLAFLVALQVLPPRQRAVLLLRDVVGLEATECGHLLDMSVPAIKSALQRARETVEARAAEDRSLEVDDTATRSMLARYLQAWERADVAEIVSLLHEDATFSMPPQSEWLAGPRAIGRLLEEHIYGAKARAGVRLLETHANGASAFAVYFREHEADALGAKAIQVVHVRGGRVAGIVNFLGAATVTAFGLPARL
jgi:RNA polymerase sigma-70 factor (ECF subfamily)